MIKRIRLMGFKNFHDATLSLGSFTVLVGTNASGKSNIRDAFRFLHGLSRGYTLAEIIGEKWADGGVLQWRGIRGGMRETASHGLGCFSIGIDLTVNDKGRERDAHYMIEVSIDGDVPRVRAERLTVDGRGQYVFDTHPESSRPEQPASGHEIIARIRKEGKAGFLGPAQSFMSNRPVLSQLPDREDIALPSARALCRLALNALKPMQFLDLSPDAMRQPSFPGQDTLGDRGENLSTVLQSICESESKKRVLVDWLRELTPMDAADFQFIPDQTGRVLMTLVESNGQSTTAYSASDGTLRFLAMIAALLGPNPAKFYFFEELENGVHPTRLSVLLELIERETSQRGIQIVATTHSPELLTLMDMHSVEQASIVYRDEDEGYSTVKRVLDVPEMNAEQNMDNLGNLFASGWFEDVLSFTGGAK